MSLRASKNNKYSISIKNFVITINRNIENMKYGINRKTKLKILLLLFLLQVINSNPFKLILETKKLNIIKTKTLQVINQQFKNLKVCINDCTFILKDLESFVIVSPEFESEVQNYFKPKEGDVFVDIGAHIGKYTIQAAKKIGDSGKVVAVEAHPENYRYLLKNISENDLQNRVIAYNLAACDKAKKLRLFIGDAGGHHSIIKNFGKGYIEVQGYPLDWIIDKLKIDKVDWIKIDVEGAECSVLRGLKNTLVNFSPKLIVEVLNENYNEVIKLLYSLDYNFKIIYEEPDEFKYLFCYK